MNDIQDDWQAGRFPDEDDEATLLLYVLTIAAGLFGFGLFVGWVVFA